MRNVLILVVVIFALGLGYWGIQDRKAGAPELPVGSADSSVLPADNPQAPSTIVPASGSIIDVTFKDGAFTPKVVNIKAGDTVRWSNKHVSAIRVVSNPHPFHTSYPALDSDTLDPDDVYSLTFKEKVTVDYHNHFNPGVVGQIVVE